ALWKHPLHTDLNPHPPDTPRTESVQPVRPLLSRRRPLHQQFRPRDNKHPHQANGTPGSSKIIHQIESSSLSADSLSQAQSILSSMQPDHSNSSIASQSVSQVHHNWLYRRVALPVFALL